LRLRLEGACVLVLRRLLGLVLLLLGVILWLWLLLLLLLVGHLVLWHARRRMAGSCSLVLGCEGAHRASDSILTRLEGLRLHVGSWRSGVMLLLRLLLPMRRRGCTVAGLLRWRCVVVCLLRGKRRWLRISILLLERLRGRRRRGLRVSPLFLLIRLWRFRRRLGCRHGFSRRTGRRILAPQLGRRRGHRRGSLLLGHLLRWSDLCPGSDRRLFCEDTPQHSQKVEYRRFVPVASPLRQIWVIDAPVAAHVLARAHQHVFLRLDIDNRRLAWIGIRQPDSDREAIGRAAERHWEGTAQADEKRGCAIFVGWIHISQACSAWSGRQRSAGNGVL
jgi:multisubunit Na+/H+ antiporter MnhG subunit